jgi:anti-sigma regulatory factor (Ser/Thr protein kinase)
MTGPAPFNDTAEGRTTCDNARRPAEVDLAQPFTAEDLYTLRAAVEAHAEAHGAPPHAVDALLIAAGELASNVVVHGGGRGELALWREGTDLVCAVSDRGPGIADPQRAGCTPVPPAALSGRGLWMVRQLGRDVTITSGPDGTTVTVVIAAT